MNEKKMMELKEKYPIILKDLGGDPIKTCMSWDHGGISIGDGWIPLIDTLMEFLQFHTDKNGYPQVIATQIKEKFGTLRFYSYRELNTTCKYPKFRSDRTKDFLSGAISFAESISQTICKNCGSPGKLRFNGRARTVCNECERSK